MLTRLLHRGNEAPPGTVHFAHLMNWERGVKGAYHWHYDLSPWHSEQMVRTCRHGASRVLEVQCCPHASPTLVYTLFVRMYALQKPDRVLDSALDVELPALYRELGCEDILMLHPVEDPMAIADCSLQREHVDVSHARFVGRACAESCHLCTCMMMCMWQRRWLLSCVPALLQRWLEHWFKHDGSTWFSVRKQVRS